MKKATLIILIQLITYSSLSQIKHSINLEYNIGYYFDNKSIKKKPFFSFPRPPSLNYQIFIKENGLELSYKFLESIYYNGNSSYTLPDSILTSRQTVILGLGALKKINILSNKYFYTPKIGVAYIIASNYYHLGYRNPNGPLTEPVGDAKRTSTIAMNLGSRIETSFINKINAYIGLNYYNQFHKSIQNDILSFDIGIGYIINRRKK